MFKRSSSHHWGPGRRWLAKLTVVTVSAATAVSVATPAQAAPPPWPVLPHSVEHADAKPDVFAAQLAAQDQGSRVRVSSLDDATSSTYANPDGSVTKDIAPGPIRVRRDDAWVPVNYDLKHVDGGWAPDASPVPLVFSDGGDADAVQLGAGSKSLGLSWDVTLPSPQIDGPSATYDLGGGEHLLLTATSTGFEQSLVLDAPPTSLPKLRMPLETSGLTLSDDGAAGITFADADGKAVYSMPAPVMYGNASDPDTGEPLETKQVDATWSSSPDGDRLDLTPSLAWLRSPDRTYPVRIDPTIESVDQSGDTFVQDNVTTAQGSNSALHVGMYGGHKARAYLRYTLPTDLTADTPISNASLRLYNNTANDCEPATIDAYPLMRSVAFSSVVWSNRPAAGESPPAYSTSPAWAGHNDFANGVAGSCENDYASIDVTNMAAAWASGALVNYGLQLSGTETPGNQGWGFCSMNLNTTNSTSCTTVPREPTLSITYSKAPDANQLISGTAMDGSTPIANADVVLFPRENSATVEASAEGDEKPLELAGATRTDANGKFVLVLNPAALPAKFVEADGQTTNFWLEVANSTQQMDWAFGAVKAPTTSGSPSAWRMSAELDEDSVTTPSVSMNFSSATAYDTQDDPAQDLTEDDDDSVVGPSARAMDINDRQASVDVGVAIARSNPDRFPQYATPASRTSPTSTEPTQTEPEGSTATNPRFPGCVATWGTWYRDRYDHFMDVYAFSGALATVTEGQTNHHTLGLGFSASSSFAHLSYGGNEEKTFETTSDSSATKPRLANRHIYNSVNYRNQSIRCDGTKYGGRVSYFSERLPVSIYDYMTKFTASHVKRFKYCAKKYGDSSWSTTKKHAISFGHGVDISGLSVHSQSGFGKSQNITYNYTQDGYVCGTSPNGPLSSPRVDSQATKT